MAPPATALRKRPKACALALLALYLPTAVPFLIGPLRTSRDAVATYLDLLPVLPGCFLGAIAPPLAIPGFWVAATITAALGCGAYAAARRLPTRDLIAAYAVLMALTSVQCHFLGSALRA